MFSCYLFIYLLFINNKLHAVCQSCHQRKSIELWKSCNLEETGFKFSNFLTKSEVSQQLGHFCLVFLSNSLYQFVMKQQDGRYLHLAAASQDLARFHHEGRQLEITKHHQRRYYCVCVTQSSQLGYINSKRYRGLRNSYWYCSHVKKKLQLIARLIEPGPSRLQHDW